MIMQNVLHWHYFSQKEPPKNKQVLVTNGNQVWAAHYATDTPFWERTEREGWVVHNCEDYYYTYHLLDEKLIQWAEMPVVLGK